MSWFEHIWKQDWILGIVLSGWLVPYSSFKYRSLNNGWCSHPFFGDCYLRIHRAAFFTYSSVINYRVWIISYTFPLMNCRHLCCFCFDLWSSMSAWNIFYCYFMKGNSSNFFFFLYTFWRHSSSVERKLDGNTIFPSLVKQCMSRSSIVHVCCLVQFWFCSLQTWGIICANGRSD